MAPITETVDIAGLRELYESNSCAEALLDYAADRTRNSWETRVGRLMRLLRGAETDFSRRDLVYVLRQLQELGVGQFVVGRRGQPSRFQWEASMITVGKAARGDEIEIELLDEESVDVENDEDDEDELDLPDGAIRHVYKLRPELQVRLDLPSSLTTKEAERLADFVRTLPFDGA